MGADKHRLKSERARARAFDRPVGIVVVNYRTAELTEKCLAALEGERAAFRSLRVIVVDGGSNDGSPQKISEWIKRRGAAGWIELLPLAVNGGFGWANNQGMQRLIRRAEPPVYIHLLNPDTEIETGAIFRLAAYLDSHPRTGAVGSQLVDTDGLPMPSAFNFPSIRGEFARGARTQALERLLKVPAISIEASEPTEVDWVTGGSVMLRVDALRAAGVFDEGFFLYNEEVELMWRLRKAGWAIATEPDSRVRHIGGGATGLTFRETVGEMEPRKPAYLLRSRARFFGLTRGPVAAAAAYAAWLVGHGIWRARHLLGLGTGKHADHEFRDHFFKAFPRRHDCRAARISLDDEPTSVPAWMKRNWL